MRQLLSFINAKFDAVIRDIHSYTSSGYRCELSPGRSVFTPQAAPPTISRAQTSCIRNAVLVYKSVMSCPYPERMIQDDSSLY
jgi:hypothetical protein